MEGNCTYHTQEARNISNKFIFIPLEWKSNVLIWHPRNWLDLNQSWDQLYEALKNLGVFGKQAEQGAIITNKAWLWLVNIAIN